MKQVSLATGWARAVIEGCGFRYYADITSAAVLRFLAQRREAGLSTQSSNYYLQAFKQLCRWLVAERRASESPVAHLKGLNVRTDRRHDRRALSIQETRRFLAAARKGPTVWGMIGHDREMLYTVVLETGLRWSELASLTPESFSLAGPQPTVTVQACYAKNRRADTLPLRRGTAAALQEYLSNRPPTALAFPMPKSQAGAKILRVDREAAGIPYADQGGRVADFHSLRHCLLTNCANSGIHPSVAQRLARHSDVNLTLRRYTHSALERQSEAVEKLPDLSEGAIAASEPEALRAMGTEMHSILAFCLAKQGRLGAPEGDQFRQPIALTAKQPDGLADGKKAVIAPFDGAKDAGGPRRIRTSNQRIMSPLLCR